MDFTTEIDVAKKTTEKQYRAFAGGTNDEEPMSPEECAKLCKATNNLEYLSGYENRIKVYTITDESCDRYGDIVRAKGCKPDNYKKNPVIQFAHNYEELPIGNTIKLVIDKAKKVVRATALFFDDRVDSSGRSDLIYRFIQANGMRACSIGFMPLEYNMPKTDEERAAMGLGKYGVEFTSWDLMEFSPVPVPANPNALRDDYREGFKKSLSTTLRSGKFSAHDVEILKRYPLFDETILDAFVKEIGGTSIVVPEYTLKDVQENFAALVKAIDEIKVKVDETIKEVKALPSIITVSSGETPKAPKKSLYDLAFKDDNN